MNTKSITIINARFIKARVRIALLAVAAVAFLPVIATAHGGEEHVTGTVAKVSATAVTVKTRAGAAVEVGFDAKTTYSRAEKPVQKTDIKAGDRVVIHAVEVNEKLVAHTVELGGVNPAAKSK
jgi:hypothetical protein